MPVVKLHVVKGKSPEHLRGLKASVRDAVAVAFELPPADVTQLLFELDEAQLDGKGRDFTYIEVIAIAGRSSAAKRKLYRRMVDNICESTRLAPTDVLIMLHDMPKDNCGIRGGQMASDVELGFKVEV